MYLLFLFPAEVDEINKKTSKDKTIVCSFISIGVCLNADSEIFIVTFSTGCADLNTWRFASRLGKSVSVAAWKRWKVSSKVAP